MALEIVEPGRWTATAALGEGEASLSRTGTLTILAADAESVGLGPWVLVLVDRKDRRIGLRSPEDDERVHAVALSVVSHKGKDRGRRRVGVKRALDLLGLTGDAVAGRYTLLAKGNTALIHLDEVRASGAQGASAK